MRSSCLALLLLIFAAGPVAAQDAPVASDAAPTAPPSLPEVLAIGTDIPGRMTVPVTIGTAKGASGPYPFTIDTGAQRTVISRQLARLLGLARGRDVRVTAMTGAAMTSTVLVPDLRVSVAGAKAIEAPVFDGTHLGAPGLLGLDSLQGHAVRIDFDANTLAVIPSGNRQAAIRAAPDEIIVRAKSLFGQLVVTDATYRGQRVRVVLDTGSSISIGNLAFRRKVSSGKAGLRPIGLTSVTGATLTADYTQLAELQIGSVVLRNLPVAFADAAPFARFGLASRPALLLGLDALRQFRRVDIDFANREIRLALPRDRR